MSDSGGFPSTCTRTRLVEVTIRLLAENGPSDIKARSVSSEAGLSTMAVYSHFGGVPELLQAVAEEGFQRQAALFERVISTDEPMTNLCAMALACRDFAHSNAHLYDLMFGLSIHGRYSPPRGNAPQESKARSSAFKLAYGHLHGECVRLIDGNFVRKTEPDLVAAQTWSALHGFLMLELGGYFAEVPDPTSEILMQSCINLVVGLGANRSQAEASAAAAIAEWKHRKLQPTAAA